MKNAVTDNDLHAYVDGHLDQERRREVESYLSTRPDKAVVVNDYRQQRIILHRLFDGIEDRAMPRDLRHLATEADRALRVGRLIRTGTRAAVVCAAFLFVTVTVFYGAPNIVRPDASDTLKDFRQQAVQAHLALGDNPLETDPALEGPLPAAPELDAVGLIPVARRLIHTNSGAALQVVYVDSDDSRVTLYAQTVDSGFRHAVTFVAEDGVGQMYWRNNGVAFSLLGPSDKEQLSRIADAIGGIGTAMFTLPDLPLDAASTAVQMEPLAEGAPEEIEAAPAPPAEIENEAPDEAIPATQSRRQRPQMTVAS